MIVFNSKFVVEGFIDPDQFNESTIKSEPMLSAADLKFAQKTGGAITQAFLAALPKPFDTDLVIDSRVQTLDAGWLPHRG